MLVLDVVRIEQAKISSNLKSYLYSKEEQYWIYRAELEKQNKSSLTFVLYGDFSIILKKT